MTRSKRNLVKSCTVTSSKTISSTQTSKRGASVTEALLASVTEALLASARRSSSKHFLYSRLRLESNGPCWVRGD